MLSAEDTQRTWVLHRKGKMGSTTYLPKTPKPPHLPKAYLLFPFQTDHQEYSEITLCHVGPNRLNKSIQHQPGCKPSLCFMHRELSHREASFDPGPQHGENSLDLGVAGLTDISEAHNAKPGQMSTAGERRCRLGLGSLGEGCAVLFWGCLGAQMA